MKKSDHLLYEPPRARDLSVTSVTGIVPLGYCVNGGTPYESCQNGDIFQTGDTCTNGGAPSDDPMCLPGNIPGGPKCTIGSMAQITCVSGGKA